MNSKKFTVAIALILFGVMGVVYLSLWILPEEKYMQGEYGAWMQQKDYATCRHDKSEIILLGDSRMKIGIAASGLSDDTYNLSLAGSNPIDMYYTLKRYLNAGNIPQKVFIGFAPKHFTFYENYTNRGLFFHYYDDAEMAEINARILQYEGIDYSREVYKYKFRSPSVYLTALLHSLKEDREQQNKSLYDELSHNKGTLNLSGKKDDGSAVIPEECKEKDFKIKKILDYYLCETINMCKERDVPVYVLQLPMGQKGLEILKSTGYMTYYESYMQSIADRTGIDVEITIPAYEDKYFADNSHLNVDGQKKYTDEVKRKYVLDKP